MHLRLVEPTQDGVRVLCSSETYPESINQWCAANDLVSLGLALSIVAMHANNAAHQQETVDWARHLGFAEEEARQVLTDWRERYQEGGRAPFVGGACMRFVEEVNTALRDAMTESHAAFREEYDATKDPDERAEVVSKASGFFWDCCADRWCGPAKIANKSALDHWDRVSALTEVDEFVPTPPPVADVPRYLELMGDVQESRTITASILLLVDRALSELWSVQKPMTKVARYCLAADAIGRARVYAQAKEPKWLSLVLRAETVFEQDCLPIVVALVETYDQARRQMLAKTKSGPRQLKIADVTVSEFLNLRQHLPGLAGDAPSPYVILGTPGLTLAAVVEYWQTQRALLAHYGES